MGNLKKIFMASLATLACVTGLSACKSLDKLPDEAEYDYDWTYVQEFVDESDPFMEIDGTLDEDLWQDAHWLYHGEDNVKLSYTTVFTLRGMYIGAKAEDTKMRWNARFNFSHLRGNGALNSAFWFQIAGPDVVDHHSFRQFNFFVDAFDSASRNQTRFVAETTTNGDILKNEATEMVVEMFVTWDALNIELDEDGNLPEFVYLTPSYRYVVENDANSLNNRWIIPTGTYPNNLLWWNYQKGYAGTLADFNYYRAKTGIHFNKDGYVNYDQEDALVGMSANGICKSDGWDLTNATTTGEVSCVAPYEQFLFIKDVYAEDFHLKADVVFSQYADGNPGNEWPNLGFAVVQSNTNSRCFFISGDTVLSNQKDGDRYSTFGKTIDLKTWEQHAFNRIYAEPGKNVPQEGFSVELVKTGSVIYYIIEGQLNGIENVDALAGKACPALFSIGGRGTFKNIEVQTEIEKVNEVLDKYVRTVSVQVQGSGTVTPDKYALKMSNGEAVESLSVSIYPDINYIVDDILITGLTINESDSWQFFLNNYKDGKLLIAKEFVKDTINISVKFSRIRATLAAEQVVELSGTLKNEKGVSMVGEEVIIYSKSFPSLYYKITTSNMGAYTALVPREGTYKINGKTIYIDGIYCVNAVVSGGYKVLNSEIDTTTVTESKIKRDFSMELLEFQLTRFPSNTYNSTATYTNTGAYQLIGLHQLKDKTVEQGEDFVLYTTINPLESSAIGTEVGFIVGTGDDTNGQYLFFALKRTGDKFLAYIWSNGGSSGIAYNSKTVFFKGENEWMNLYPFGENKDQPLKMALVYHNGKYMMYLNDCLAFTLKETDKTDEGYPIESYKNIIGTEGVKKLGFISLNARTAFYDWGYTTDEDEISKYIPTEEPGSGDMAAIYTEGGYSSATQQGTSIIIDSGSYVIGKAEVAYGSSFVLKTMIAATESHAGFVLTAQDGYYVNVVYRPRENDIYVWKSHNDISMLYKWMTVALSSGVDVFGANNDTATEMALVYKEGTYYVFFDGVLGCQFSEDVCADEWECSTKAAIGTGDTIKVGLASGYGATTFTAWSYSTEASEIANYVPNKQEPDGVDMTAIYTEGSYSKVIQQGTNIIIDSGSYVIGESEVAYGSSFVLKTTIAATASHAGFVLTAQDGYYVNVVYRPRENDIYVWKSHNDISMLYKWMSVAISSGVDVFGANNDTATEMALVYKEGTYYVFFDGVLGCQFSEDVCADEWECSTKVAIGTGDTIKVGLASGYGATTFTAWSYSTEASEIAKYVTN